MQDAYEPLHTSMYDAYEPLHTSTVDVYEQLNKRLNLFIHVCVLQLTNASVLKIYAYGAFNTSILSTLST